mgnify:CR=1 FL=1
MKKHKVSLSEEISIFTIASIWEKFIKVLEKFEKKDTLILDCEKLEAIDGAGIQLLLSLEKTILKESYKIKYINYSENIKDIFEKVGVSYLLVTEGDINE